MHFVDLGESFPTRICLQNLASIQPRTIVRSTAAAAENEPCKGCPPSVYRPPRYEAMLGMEENEHELELEKKRSEFDVELKAASKKTMTMRNEHDALLRGLDMMVKDQEKVAKAKYFVFSNSESKRIFF